MYLTRIPLNVERRDTVQALYSPNLLHGAVEASFPGERERRLWRIDTLRGVTYLMILSAEQPDLAHLQQQFGYPDQPGESKDYEPLLAKVTEGSVWHFRLAANPTQSIAASDPGERGTVKAITVIAKQKGWLMEQADKHGFHLEVSSFDVVSTEWKRFQKGTAKGRPVTLLQAVFEGILVVTDTEQFTKTLVEGIGRGKAYGMGLMTVMKNA